MHVAMSTLVTTDEVTSKQETADLLVPSNCIIVILYYGTMLKSLHEPD